VTALFNKYEGTGNDFVIIDNRDLSFISDNHKIERLCNRRFGIGADGLILIEPSDEAHFRMRYFNSDGKEGSMCGNGGRCAAHFALSHSIAPREMTFIAYDGLHSAVVTGNHVLLSMSDVRNYIINAGSCFINTGSPHHVEFVPDPYQTDVESEGRAIRHARSYAPDGTNVNFAAVAGDILVVRTFERGVEAETLSCGTGVTASAIAAVLCGHFDSSPVPVRTPGGNLKVSFRIDGDVVTDIFLEGAAKFVFKGDIYL
jgi:diaminopimelate epimerase